MHSQLRMHLSIKTHYSIKYTIKEGEVYRYIEGGSYLYVCFGQVMGEGNKKVVTICHGSQMYRFTGDLLRVLRTKPSKQVVLSDLPALWQTVLGKLWM